MKSGRRMEPKLLEFLVASGGAALDELVARVSSRPHNLVESLKSMDDQGLIKIAGPRNVDDLQELVEGVRKVNGYDSYSKGRQRKVVLKHIFKDASGFSETMVRLSVPGYALALD